MEYRDEFGKKTGKTKQVKMKCGDPCKDFIMYGCGRCPPSCHQPIWPKDLPESERGFDNIIN